MFGTQITVLALPLLAVLLLEASSLQMGLLAASGTAPFLFLSLFAGAWVDRHQRRPVLIGADLCRAALLLSIPAAAWLDLLRIEQLYLVAFAAGTMTVFSEVAEYAYVPSLVGRSAVVEANSKLQVSHSAAEAGGPGVAGLLVQLVSAPGAILVDGVSYLVSAILLRGIETPERALDRGASRGVRHEIATGLRLLLGHKLLRPIVVGSTIDALCASGITAILVLYATRELELSPVALGAIFAVGGAGAVLGGPLSAPTARRFGVGATIVGGWLIMAASWLVVPAATGPNAIPLLAAGMLVGGVAGTILNVQQWSLRQLVTPDALQGRVTAGHRFLVYGAYPVGALLGGWLGTAIGLRPTLGLLALLGLTAPLPVAFSPVRQLREQPVSDTST